MQTQQNSSREAAVHSHSAVIPEPAAGLPETATECSAFFRLNAKQVRVTTFPYRLHVEILSSGGQGGDESLFDELANLVQNVPDGWWVVFDLGAKNEYNLHSLNIVVAVGRQLALRGGRLILNSFHPNGIPEPFLALFLKRCEEESIDLVVGQ